MGHSVKLHYGTNPTQPQRSLDLAGGANNVYLSMQSATVAGGEEQVFYTELNPRTDGQMRLGSSRKNSEVSIGLDLRGSTPGQIEAIRQAITRFFEEAREYHENKVGAPVWLEYRWSNNLGSLAQPSVGQLSKFYRILGGGIPVWPQTIHDMAVLQGYTLGVVCKFTAEPFMEGQAIQLWEANGLPGVDADVTLKRTLGTELTGQWTAAGWVQHRASNYVVWEYYDDINNYLRVEWDQTDGRFEVVRRVSGSTTTTNGSTQSLSAGEWVRVTVYQDASNIILRVNKTQRASTTAGTLAGYKTLKLGCATSVATTANNNVDGWRVWTGALTSTELDALYDDEQPVLAAGLYVGRPPWHKTREGDGTYDSVDGVISTAARDHWGVCGWIPGDTAALTEWQIVPPTGSAQRVYWLGRCATDAGFTPNGTLWLDFSGTAASGTASGDAYESSGAGTSIYVFDAPLGQVIAGTYEFIGSIRVTTNPVTVQPYYKLGSGNLVLGDAVTIATSGTFVLRDFGELELPANAPGTTYEAGLVVTRASTATVDVDFVQALPRPGCRVEAEQVSISTDAGDILQIATREAQFLDASVSYSRLQGARHRGDPVTLLPNKYNTIFLLPGGEGVTYPVSHESTVQIFITPRWVLPGGAVA
jgi:hypothetical protein